jgi:hypothetical protein
VPRAYEDKGAYESKNDRKGAYKEKKWGKRGLWICQNEWNRPSKKICSTNIKKVPRAYESLNPALSLVCRWESNGHCTSSEFDAQWKGKSDVSFQNLENSRFRNESKNL